MIELYYQTVAYIVEIRDLLECLPFALFGALAVHGVKKGNITDTMAFQGNSGTDAGVHASAKQHYGFWSIAHNRLVRVF
jgi:hypothetical protein